MGWPAQYVSNKDKRYFLYLLFFVFSSGSVLIILLKSKAPKEYGDVYFEDFYDLYKFDIQINKLTLFKVFDIESRLRTSIAYHFSENHCNTITSTLNYINSSCYQAPSPSDTYLTNKFNSFDLFKKAEYDSKTGVLRKLSFIDQLKKDKEYISKYTAPPFWVVIKALPLGTLYYTYLFLDCSVKPCVLKDYGFSLSDTNIFEQSLYLLKEIRNHCAHLELITRFKLKRSSNLNYFNDLAAYSFLSKTNFLNYMDVLKNFKIYGSVGDIKWTILLFYIKMCAKGRRKIARKILGKMGQQSVFSWLAL